MAMPDTDLSLLNACDEMVWSFRALCGLRDLVQEAARGDARFDLVQPTELGELLEMVTNRMEPAVQRLTVNNGQ